MGQVKKNSDFWYHVAAFAMILVWGISFLNTRVLLDAGLTPTEIFVARFTIAYLSLLVVSRFKVRYTGWRDELLFVVCGIAGGSAYFIAENTALELTLISDVAVLVSIAPLTTALNTDSRSSAIHGVSLLLPARNCSCCSPMNKISSLTQQSA